MAHYSLVVGYHGCDRSVGERVLLGKEELSLKTNPWDWLGTGIYFWEGSPRRALAFAEEKKKRGWGDNPIVEPYVIGAYINLGNCFDLTDIEAVQEIPTHHQLLLKTLTDAGKPIPTNRSPRGEEHHDLVLRNLDCLVMNFTMRVFDSKAADGSSYYHQTVRGVFVEGDPVYEGARIYEKTHVQIAVRDPSSIIGYFRPS
ncbi:MAG: hypothetical protein JKY65_18490 [Planctomycetes bacterium]|nr:hypothetical protein [Planctomycetota bacterium]